MMKAGLVIAVLMGLALPVFGKTYKNVYPVQCSQVWGAVKVTLGNTDNYAKCRATTWR